MLGASLPSWWRPRRLASASAGYGGTVDLGGVGGITLTAGAYNVPTLPGRFSGLC